MKSHFTFKTIFFIFSTLFLGSGFANAQKPVNVDKAEDIVSGIKERIFGDIYQQQHMTSVEITEFNKFYEDSIAKYQRLLLKRLLKNLSFSDAQQLQYIDKAETYYTQLYYNYKRTKAEFPSAIEDALKPQAVGGVCEPACSNIDFESGDLRNWTTCYAANNSTTTAFITSTPTCSSAPLGAGVIYSAHDPSTSSYQVSLTSGTGNDPVVGAAIPLVCPFGGKHSCRIGDSTKNGYGVAFLEQTFMVTKANEDLNFMYAIVLEDPTTPPHPYYQQPYVTINFIDQNGDTIPGCSNYSLIAGSDTGQGWYNLNYSDPSAGITRVNYLPWTSRYVRLTKYLGTCVTLIVKAADCALGGHFGYAYFDAQCQADKITVSSSSICGNPITLSAPSGGASYKWSGPCITGSDTTQAVSVTCAGKYSVIIKSIFGAACSDTLDTVITITPGVKPVANFTFDTACLGSTTQFTNLTSGSGASTAYTWSFGDTGAGLDDSSTLTNPTHTYPATGSYSVTLSAANGGCQNDTSFIVSVSSGPNVKIIIAMDTVCSIATADSLSANPTGGIFSGPGVIGNNFNPSNAGIGNFYIRYTYTNTGHCSATDSIPVSVQVCTGVGNIKSSISEVVYYPNPFSKNLTIDLSSINNSPVITTLFNMLGQSIGTWTMDKAHNNINTESIPSGVYMLQIRTKNKLLNKKVIKVD